MKQKASLGSNCTGVATSGGRADEMKKGSDAYGPTSHGAPDGPGKVRVEYAREGFSIGSVPPPHGAKKVAGKALEKLKGGEPTLFMDKLGERLAFERTGTRLYAALISKHEAYGDFAGGPSRADLLEILEEEHRHFILLEQAIYDAGGDPTAMTPSADLAATAAKGVQQVITDPRTTFLQSLEAILIAELTDVDGWESLTTLARAGGKDDLASEFEEARLREDQHLYKVRNWLHAGHNGGQLRAAE